MIRHSVVLAATVNNCNNKSTVALFKTISMCYMVIL